MENYSINLEEESQIQHEKYKELLFEKHSIKEEISDLNDQSSLVHQNRVSLAQDLAKNMIYLFKENVREGDKVIISQETVLEILNRLEELIKNVGVSDQEIKGVIEEISVQTGTFKKVCQAAFLVQLNFQSIWKENIKLRHS
uniref:hypothetical protein n=1 Tax=Wolbachia endosymbiont (group B) of Protocalliphora azurea TaxID=2954051 RepID=UPI00222F1090|nr:hypothetical protein [Wolbachia endosymbiont (group B) of Protocalliphora azurea]